MMMMRPFEVSFFSAPQKLSNFITRNFLFLEYSAIQKLAEVDVALFVASPK